MSLEDRLHRDRVLPLPEVLRIGREAALGLAAAHAAGLVHRDIKPADLWLEGDRGRIKVLDFGLARPSGGSSQLTHAGLVLGTPAYMAPEQAESRPVDARADVFSLGCVLYRASTGQAPFPDGSLMAVLRAVLLDQPPPPHEVNPGVSPALSALVMRMLAKQPDARPASASEVADALAALERGPKSPASPAPRRAGNATVRRRAPRNQSGSASSSSVAARNTPYRRAIPVVLAGLVGLLALAAAWWRATPTIPVASAPAVREPPEGPGDGSKSAPTTVTGKPEAAPAPAVPRAEAPAGAPRLRLLPPPKVTLYAGQTVTVPVAVDRGGVRGPIVLDLQKLPAGVTAESTVLPAGRDRADVLFRVSATTPTPSAATSRVRAAVGEEEAEAPVQVEVTRPAGELAYLNEPSWGPSPSRETDPHGADLASDKIVNVVTLTPDGRQLITCANRQHVRLWDVATGREIRRFQGPADLQYIVSLALSPDGRYVVAVGRYYAIIWDVATGAEVFRTEVARTPTKYVMAVAISPDGSTLATMTGNSYMNPLKVSHPLTVGSPCCWRMSRDPHSIVTDRGQAPRRVLSLDRRP